MSWFIRRGESQWGPMSWEELAAGARTGNVGPYDLVWTEGMPGWQTAVSVPALYSAGIAAAPQAPVNMADDPLTRWTLPVGRSGWAIAAGYLGLFAVLLFFAPFALATGIIAIWDIRRHPEKLGMGRAIFGIVMGSLGTALLLYLIIFNP